MNGSTGRVRALAAVFAVNGALYGTLLPRFPEIADRLEASEGDFGLALLGVGAGGVVGALLVTRLGRAVGGPHLLVRTVGTVMVLAMVAAGLAWSLMALGFALALFGMSDGLVDPAMNGVAVAEQRRTGGGFMGRLHATWSASTLAATGIGAGVAALGVGVATHVLAVGGLLLAAQLVASRRIGTADPALLGEDAETDVGTLRPGSVPGGPAPLGRAARIGGGPALAWLALGVLAVAAVWVEVPPGEWSGLLLARELGAAPGVAGSGPFAFLAGVLAGRLVLDRAVAWAGWWRVATLGAIATLVGSTAALVLGAATGAPWVVLAGLAVAGTGVGPLFPLMYDRAAFLARSVGRPADAGAGIVSSLTRVGVLAGPVVVGQVADVAGLFVALTIVPAAAVGVLLGVLALRPAPAGPPTPTPAT